MIKKILVPVDFNDQSRGAVREAIVFAQAFGAAVEVAHLWRRPGTQTPGAERAINEFSESEQGAQMRHYLDSLEQHGVDVRGRLQVVHDEPHRAIVELAEREEFDLIVIGTHGAHGGVAPAARQRRRARRAQRGLPGAQRSDPRAAARAPQHRADPGGRGRLTEGG